MFCNNEKNFFLLIFKSKIFSKKKKMYDANIIIIIILMLPFYYFFNFSIYIISRPNIYLVIKKKNIYCKFFHEYALFPFSDKYLNRVYYL